MSAAPDLQLFLSSGLRLYKKEKNVCAGEAVLAVVTHYLKPFRFCLPPVVNRYVRVSIGARFTFWRCVRNDWPLGPSRLSFKKFLPGSGSNTNIRVIRHRRCTPPTWWQPFCSPKRASAILISARYYPSKLVDDGSWQLHRHSDQKKPLHWLPNESSDAVMTATDFDRWPMFSHSSRQMPSASFPLSLLIWNANSDRCFGKIPGTFFVVFGGKKYNSVVGLALHRWQQHWTVGSLCLPLATFQQS